MEGVQGGFVRFRSLARSEMEETFVEGNRFEEASACYLGRCRIGEKVAPRNEFAHNANFVASSWKWRFYLSGTPSS